MGINRWGDMEERKRIETNEENALARTARIQRTDGERMLPPTGERNR